MHAHDRFLPDWFSRVRSRQITLPRFQRFVAWGHSEVSALLTSVVRGLPSGAALILEVGEEEKFTSRTIVDAPEGSERVNEQLLDGQQRVTALWRSMHDTYEDRTYLIGFEEAFEGDEEMIPFVYGQARWIRGDRRYPVWVDDPVRCWRRGLIPISLLRPGDIQGEIERGLKKRFQMTLAISIRHTRSYLRRSGNSARKSASSIYRICLYLQPHQRKLL